jgi:predicted DCC family thiol-disulfide oxidoreductase YuxK
MNNDRIVFYDDVCVLCNRSVKLLIFLNWSGNLRFSSLVGDTAKKHLPQSILQSPQSVVYLRNGRLYIQSDAAIRALSDAAWCMQVVKLFLFCPRFIRDGIYDWISRNRYRVFGKYDSCEIPLEKHKSRFLR